LQNGSCTAPSQTKTKIIKDRDSNLRQIDDFSVQKNSLKLKLPNRARLLQYPSRRVCKRIHRRLGRRIKKKTGVSDIPKQRMKFKGAKTSVGHSRWVRKVPVTSEASMVLGSGRKRSRKMLGSE